MSKILDLKNIDPDTNGEGTVELERNDESVVDVDLTGDQMQDLLQYMRNAHCAEAPCCPETYLVEEGLL